MKSAFRKFGLCSTSAACWLLATGLAVPVRAQTTSTPPGTPPNASDIAQELRRQQERQQLERQQKERTPDVRLQAPEAATAVIPPTIPTDEKPCFTIQNIELRGKDAAKFAWLTQTVSGIQNDDSPVGKCLGANGINVVLKRAQDAIVAKGYVTSRVLAEPQDVSKGILALSVLPGRVRNIRFAEPVSPRATAWNAVPIRAGDILNIRDIEQALENFKRVPSAEADIKIEPSATPDESDLVISYQQAMPFRLSASADDSGGKGTGKYQGSVTLSYDNWWTLNDLFYATLSHDLGGGDPNPRGTKGYTVHYSIPFGYWTLGSTASSSRYYQSVAGASQNYVYSGTSHNVEAKVSRLVYRDAQRKTTVNLRAFQRQSNNFIDDTEVQVQQRVVGGWDLGLNHKESIGSATLEGNLTYKRGTGAFGSLRAPEEAFGEGTSRFAIITADANLSAPFKVGEQKLRYTGSWRIQNNRTPLTPQDRFGIGGRYTVRGFDGESSLSAERGWLLRNEVGLPIGETGHELYLGLDHGEVGGPSSDLLAGKRLTGAAIGLRGQLGKLQYDVFVGTPVRKPNNFKTSGGTAGFSLNMSV